VDAPDITQPWLAILTLRIIAGLFVWGCLLSWSKRGQRKYRKIVLWLLVAVASFLPPLRVIAGVPVWVRVIAGGLVWGFLLSWSERGQRNYRKIVLWLLVVVALFWPLFCALMFLAAGVLKLVYSVLKGICTNIRESHLASIEARRCPSCEKLRARVGDGSRVTGQKEYKEVGTKVVFSNTDEYYGKQGYVPGEGMPHSRVGQSKRVPCVYNVRIVYSKLYYHCKYCGFKWEKSGGTTARWENKD